MTPQQAIDYLKSGKIFDKRKIEVPTEESVQLAIAYLTYLNIFTTVINSDVQVDSDYGCIKDNRGGVRLSLDDLSVDYPKGNEFVFHFSPSGKDCFKIEENGSITWLDVSPWQKEDKK